MGPSHFPSSFVPTTCYAMALNGNVLNTKHPNHSATAAAAAAAGVGVVGDVLAAGVSSMGKSSSGLKGLVHIVSGRGESPGIDLAMQRCNRTLANPRSRALLSQALWLGWFALAEMVLFWVNLVVTLAFVVPVFGVLRDLPRFRRRESSSEGVDCLRWCMRFGADTSSWQTLGSFRIISAFLVYSDRCVASLVRVDESRCFFCHP